MKPSALPFLPLLLAAAASALKQLTVSSIPFDPEVAAGCSAAPLVAGFDEQVPYLAPRCQVDFKWVELAHHRNGTVDARIDVGGDGVTQGWAVELDFAAKSLPMRALAVSNLVGAVELSSAAGVVVMRPRLASGLGTVLLSVRLPRAWPAGRAPAIRCVREPGAGKVAAEAATEAEEDDDAWLNTFMNPPPGPRPKYNDVEAYTSGFMKAVSEGGRGVSVSRGLTNICLAAWAANTTHSS